MFDARYKSTAFIAKPCCWPLLWLVIGAFCAIGLLPFLADSITTDLSRTSTVLRALEKSKPKAIVFGNSVIMEGINGELLEELSGLKPVLNAATTAQSLSESFLYYQQLDVSLVIQFLNLQEVSNPGIFSETVYNTFWLAGYQANTETKHLLLETFPEHAELLFEKSSLWHRLHSRWRMQQFADRTLREMFRNDGAAERALHDLRYPYSYTQKISSTQLERQILNAARIVDDRSDLQLQRYAALANNIARNARDKPYRQLLVVAPLHPQLLRQRPQAYQKLLSDLRASIEADLLDASELLPESAFIDDRHPDQHGAELLTRWLAAQVKELG